MGRKFKFSIGEFYHLYNRGTEKRRTFMNEKDRKRFVALLYICNDSNETHISNILQSGSIRDIFDMERRRPIVAIGSYCLMPNHFHILAKEIELAGISHFMQKVSTAYTMYFNKKYGRTGSLFQGRFKATHANEDAYLKYLYAYIHLNPVKLIEADWKEMGIKNRKKAWGFLREYKYSSYLDFTGNHRIERKILNQKTFPEYFTSGSKDFESLISFWFSFKDTGNNQGSTLIVTRP